MAGDIGTWQFHGLMASRPSHQAKPFMLGRPATSESERNRTHGHITQQCWVCNASADAR